MWSGVVGEVKGEVEVEAAGSDEVRVEVVEWNWRCESDDSVDVWRSVEARIE